MTTAWFAFREISMQSGKCLQMDAPTSSFSSPSVVVALNLLRNQLRKTLRGAMCSSFFAALIVQRFCHCHLLRPSGKFIRKLRDISCGSYFLHLLFTPRDIPFPVQARLQTMFSRQSSYHGGGTVLSCSRNVAVYVRISRNYRKWFNYIQCR